MARSAPSQQQQEAQKPGKLVNFLRGQRGNEGFESNSLTKLFRHREAVLGDIVDSQPVYVGSRSPTTGARLRRLQGRPPRTAMVYVGANDGMLHAFYATLDPLDVKPARKLGRDSERGSCRTCTSWRTTTTSATATSSTSTARRSSATSGTARDLADDPRRRAERRRQGLLRARRHDAGRDADAAVGVQAGLGHLPGRRRRRRWRQASSPTATSA